VLKVAFSTKPAITMYMKIFTWYVPFNDLFCLFLLLSGLLTQMLLILNRLGMSMSYILLPLINVWFKSDIVWHHLRHLISFFNMVIGTLIFLWTNLIFIIVSVSWQTFFPLYFIGLYLMLVPWIKNRYLPCLLIVFIHWFSKCLISLILLIISLLLL